jgi:hypothetical protein
MESNEGIVKEKQFGIHRIYKFRKKKKNAKYISDDKSTIVEIEEKYNVSVIKIEFTLDCCFLLLCNHCLNLANGVVLSRAKGDSTNTLGRKDDKEKKNFDRVEFKDISTKEHKEGIESADSDLLIYDISAGNDHVLALDSNYRVWAWGRGDYSQLHPSFVNHGKNLPVKLPLPNDAKVVQIYALNNTSMVICQGDIIYMWGSIQEGFLGNFTSQSTTGATDIIRMDKITNAIIDDTKKNDFNYSEIFFNSRKLFNPKYTQTLDDNNQKQNRIMILQQQVNNLKQDIEERSKKNQNAVNLISLKSSDKRVTNLQELLKIYEDKINRLISTKETLRKELIFIEAEVTQKERDRRKILFTLVDNISEISTVEDKLEKYQAEESKTDKKDEKALVEISNKIYNLKIYKESLVSNLQVILTLLQEKEKEKTEKIKQIKFINNKENIFLKNRYAIEDMIQILQESLIHNAKPEDNLNKLSDKSRERFLELFKYNEKLDKSTFLSLNQEYPYYIVEDLIAISDKDIIEVSKNIETMAASMTDSTKESLNIIFEMMLNKIELITEQNKLIRYLYKVFVNLEKAEVKGNRSNYINSTENKNMEYVYKDMIVDFLKEVYRTDEDTGVLTHEKKETIEKDKKSYLEKKKKHIKKLEIRNHISSNVDLNNLNNIATFKYFGNDEDKSKGFLSKIFG